MHEIGDIVQPHEMVNGEYGYDIWANTETGWLWLKSDEGSLVSFGGYLFTLDADRWKDPDFLGIMILGTLPTSVMGIQREMNS